jgi:hypothetical protein
MEASQITTLLALPEPCLLAIVQHVATDPISLCAVARAHSKLHQLSKEVPRNAKRLVDQEQLDSLLQYLKEHGRNVRCFELSGDSHTCDYYRGCYLRATLRQLPALQKLSSLRLQDLILQLQPRNGFRGLRPAFSQLPVKQLRIWGCDVDNMPALEAALLRLPELQHLSVGYLNRNIVQDPMWGPPGANLRWCVSLDVVQRLRQLTCLEIAGGFCDSEDQGGAVTALQALSMLTGLLDLRLYPYSENTHHKGRRYNLCASMLSGLHRLTRLELEEFPYVEPAALAGKTLLQHLRLTGCRVGDKSPTAVAQLLSHLQPLQQLTQVDIGGGRIPWQRREIWHIDEGNPPPTAFAALTASSKMRCLKLGSCTLPAGVWRHMFPTGKQLPQLTSLVMHDIWQTSWDTQALAAPFGFQLVSCCPGLQHLDMRGLSKSAGTSMLTALRRLSDLRTLLISPAQGTERGGLVEVCKMTGLRQLDLYNCRGLPRGLLLEVTQLQQLTRLRCGGPKQDMVFEAKVGTLQPTAFKACHKDRGLCNPS